MHIATDNTFGPYLETAIQAARLAGAILREGYNGGFSTEEKGTPGDLVTSVDRASEAALVEFLAQKHPSHGIIGEEGARTNAGAEWTWILDPLDGTTSFAHAIPFFSVCIALQHSDKTVVGAVYEPLRDELFTAVLGGGAWLNGRPIHVTTNQDLSRALLATGFPYSIGTNPHSTLEVFGEVAPYARGIRRLGSAGLDLAYLACGRFDGYWETTLKPWDCAAGCLLVEEAGGRVSDFSDRAHDIHGLETLATNGGIHQVLMERIAAGRARPQVFFPNS